MHHSWLFAEIFVGATVVDFLFKIIYIPLFGPPIWFKATVDFILEGTEVIFLVLAVADGLLSAYFHFRNRIKEKT